MFNLKSSAIYQAVKLEQNPIFRWARTLKNSFFVLSIFLFFVFFIGIFSGIISENSTGRLLGGAIMSLSLGFFFFEVNLFFETKIKNPEFKYSLNEFLLAPYEFNFASYLDLDSARIFWKAEKYRKKRNFNEIPREILLRQILSSGAKEIEFIFGRAGLEIAKINGYLKERIMTLPKNCQSELQEIILAGAKFAKEENKERISPGNLLTALSEKEPLCQLLNLNGLSGKDIKNLSLWRSRIEKKISQTKKFWSEENLLARGSLGKDFSAGYSIALDQFSTDLRDVISKTGFREIVGHEKEITFLERILEKDEINNGLLVGEPGVGRKSVVFAVAQRAFLGKSSPRINHKRIIEFDIGAVSAKTQSHEELEAVLESCLKESITAGNIIMVINDLEKYVAPGAGPGKIDVSGILARYLPFPCFQVVALTSYRGLHEIIERKPSFLNMFEKVEVSEISEAETLEFLENSLWFFERKYGKFVSYKALREIMRLSSRFMADIPFPEKALRLLDESISWLTISKQGNILLPEQIRKVVSEKIELPLEALEDKEKEKLLNLEGLIHERIINQEEAVSEVSSALRRARAEIEMRQKPIGNFLFLGPTGVGKTETSKVLAAIYFGRENRMIRLDMSEFQSIADVKRLIGTSRGDIGLLTTPVKENPFSLILFDEIEKAHPNILNLFLQVLDEGMLTDGSGRKIDFKNAIIIMTSNAGAEVIRQDLRQDKKMDMVKDDLLDYLLREKVFRPEFINRFDSVVVFKPLSRENLLGIAQLLLRKISDGLKDKGVEFYPTRQLKEKIVELSYSPEFGAREMKRVIQNKVENILAEAILKNELKRGDKIFIKVENNNFIVSKETKETYA